MKSQMADGCTPRMEYNPRWCVPAIVDCESTSYTITAVWSEGEGIQADVDPFYMNNEWMQPKEHDINVTLFPFSKQEIESADIRNGDFLHCNRTILKYVYLRDPMERQKLIKDQRIGGEQMTIKSLDDLQSHPEIIRYISKLQTPGTALKMIAILIEMKWNSDSRSLSFENHIGTTSGSDNDSEHRLLLTLFVSFDDTLSTHIPMEQCVDVHDHSMSHIGDSDSDSDSESRFPAISDDLEESLMINREEWKRQQRNEYRHYDTFNGLVVRSCILMPRSTWIVSNDTQYPFNQLFWTLMYFQQFWLGHFHRNIAPKWLTANNSNDEASSVCKRVELQPIYFKSQHVVFKWEKCLQFEDEEEVRDCAVRYHFVRKIHIKHPHDPEEMDYDQTQDEDLLDIGITSYDGIFEINDVLRIMKSIKAYLKGEGSAHFALKYVAVEDEGKEEDEAQTVVSSSSSSSDSTDLSDDSDCNSDANSESDSDDVVHTQPMECTNCSDSSLFLPFSSPAETHPIEMGGNYEKKPVIALEIEGQIHLNRGDSDADDEDDASMTLNDDEPDEGDDCIQSNNIHPTLSEDAGHIVIINQMNGGSCDSCPISSGLSLQITKNTEDMDEVKVNDNNEMLESLPDHSDHSDVSPIAVNEIPVFHTPDPPTISMENPMANGNLVLEELSDGNNDSTSTDQGSTTNLSLPNIEDEFIDNGHSDLSDIAWRPQSAHDVAPPGPPPKKMRMMDNVVSHMMLLQSTGNWEYFEINGYRDMEEIYCCTADSDSDHNSDEMVNLRIQSSLKRHNDEYWIPNEEIRELKQLKRELTAMNAMSMRKFTDREDGRCDIYIGPQLPTWWTVDIKRNLAQFGLDKLCKIYDFCFVSKSPSNCKSFPIPIDTAICGDVTVHFQDSQLCLMIFCTESVTLYSGDISVVILPGRIYCFDYATLPNETITICNDGHQCFVVMLRTSPFVRDTTLKWYSTNVLHSFGLSTDCLYFNDNDEAETSSMDPEDCQSIVRQYPEIIKYVQFGISEQNKEPHIEEKVEVEGHGLVTVQEANRLEAQWKMEVDRVTAEFRDKLRFAEQLAEQRQQQQEDESHGNALFNGESNVKETVDIDGVIQGINNCTVSNVSNGNIMSTPKETEIPIVESLMNGHRHQSPPSNESAITKRQRHKTSNVQCNGESNKARKTKTTLKSDKKSKKKAVHYLSQSVLQCQELQMIVENIADKNAVTTVETEKMILDKGLAMEDLDERRRYFEPLLSRHPELEGKILYFLGNSFYEKGEYEEAADLYVRSLKAPSNRFQSTETVSMLIEVENKLEDVTPSKVSDEQLKICWQHSQTEQMRLEWLKSSDVKSEMVGAAKCCGHLSERWRNLHGEQRWNDESLLWLKRSLNIMEMIDVIIIIHCKAGDTVDSKRPQVMMEDDKSTEEIPRKRLSAGYDPSLYVREAQNFLQLYLGCLVERFRGETYRMDTDINLQDTQYRDCFWNFHANQGLFNTDFEEYLRFELDSVFEILHWHFKDNGDEPNQWIHCDRPDMADIYVNYASYLTDVQGMHQAARDFYDVALEHSPNDPVVRWNIAELCEKTGRQKEAVREYNEAIRLARYYWTGQDRDLFIRDARKQIDDINKKKRKRRQ